MSKNSSNNVSWWLAARLWWAVTWRTFVWISLPLMLVQFGFTWLQQPELAGGMLGLLVMMASSLPEVISSLIYTSEFWFFVAITAYSIMGSIFVYGYLAEKGTFGGVELSLKKHSKK